MADNLETPDSADDAPAALDRLGDDPADSPDTTELSDDEILKEAKSRLALAEEAESDTRKKAIEDLLFISGKQWPDKIRQDRDLEARPCLVVNRLPQFVNQVTNDQRQNRSSIKVHPITSGADQETAEIMQGLIRHIEYNSNAETAYDTAFEAAARSSFGYWRVATDFVGQNSFDQEIYIKRIRNHFSVFFDPYSQEPDGSDANWAFVVDDLSPEEYRQMYPDSQMASSSGLNLESVGNTIPAWVKSDLCRVAEYFYKSYKKDTLHLLSTGESVLAPDLVQRLQDAQSAGLQASIVKTRPVSIPVIKWVKINGIEILERGEWAGKYIPIVPVYGTELYINGKRTLESVIRHAIDPQRMLNYWKSAETEAIALAPRAPYVGAEGQFEGHEAEWESANRKNHAYLEYKMTNLNGQPAPPPQRNAVEPAVQAITQASMMAADDLKATTGIYDPALGAGPPDPSGIAIQKRQNQAQIATFHFGDNLKRSLRHTGRILIDLMPKIYDTARTARIIQDDGEQKLITLNRKHQDESGKEVIYDLSAGLYDVSVDTGPSYASKRQEAAASMLDFTRAIPPQLAANCADIIVRNMDWPGAQELAERLKMMLPPALQQDPKKQQIPPQVQAQIQQMQTMIKHLSMEANKNAEIIKTKQIETMNKKMELEHDERIELAKIQADIEINLAKLKSQSATTLLEHQVNEINARMQTLGNAVPIGADDPAVQQSQQAFASDPNGGMSAGMGQGAQPSTGGPSPGQPMGSNP